MSDEIETIVAKAVAELQAIIDKNMPSADTQAQIQTLTAQRNAISAQITALQKQGGGDAQAVGKARHAIAMLLSNPRPGPLRPGLPGLPPTG
jgi:cell division protein FtsB